MGFHKIVWQGTRADKSARVDHRMNTLKFLIKIFPLAPRPYPGFGLSISFISCRCQDKDILASSIVGSTIVAAAGSGHGGLLDPGSTIPEPGIGQLRAGSFAPKKDELLARRVINHASMDTGRRTAGGM